MESNGRDHNHKGAPHVLVISFSTPGHLFPLLNLAIQLARRGITITFVSSLEEISSLVSADGDGSSAKLQSLDVRFVYVRTERVPIGAPFKVQRVMRLKGFQDACKPVMDKLMDDSRAGITGPTSIIYDMFCAWTQEVASELQIPAYMFISSGITFARLIQGCLPYHESGQFQVSETEKELVPFDWSVCIPGLPPLSYHELPDSFHVMPSDWRHRAELLGQSAGILANSFLELEDKVMETWRNVGYPGFEHIKVPKMYMIGPSFSTSAKGTPELEDSANKCLHWLGSQSPSSVLYVAFGSAVHLRPDQLHELALGLEDSKQRFLWVIPRPSFGEETPSSAKFLPAGFEARVGDHGCIVTGWAPQLQILAHAATGGFLTHSGWNSTLESITLGVPMISWPQRSDQPLNSKYLVDDLKVALRLETGPENILKRSEVERVVRLLMVESEGKAIRSRAEEFQRKAAAAMANGGSQSRNLQEFVDDISKHSPSPNSGRQ